MRTNENQEKSLQEILQAADAGDISAMGEAVAQLDMQGYDEEKEPDILKKIIGYLEKMVEAGSTDGMILLGDKYCRGDGVEKDINKAIALYTQAAENGEGFGYDCLGMMYYDGEEVERDYAKALKYLSKNKEDKAACSLYKLAEIYRQGLGIAADEEKAMSIYQEIVYDKKGYFVLDDYYPRACFRLAQLLHRQGGVKTCQEALKLVEYAKDELLNRSAKDTPLDMTEEEILAEWKSLHDM